MSKNNVCQYLLSSVIATIACSSAALADASPLTAAAQFERGNTGVSLHLAEAFVKDRSSSDVSSLDETDSENMMGLHFGISDQTNQLYKAFDLSYYYRFSGSDHTYLGSSNAKLGWALYQGNTVQVIPYVTLGYFKNRMVDMSRNYNSFFTMGLGAKFDFILTEKSILSLYTDISTEALFLLFENDTVHRVGANIQYSLGNHWDLIGFADYSKIIYEEKVASRQSDYGNLRVFTTGLGIAYKF